MKSVYAVDDSSEVVKYMMELRDPVHVDSVDYEIDRISGFVAVRFHCEHYGVCTVRKRINGRDDQLSAEEIATIVSLGNAELEKIVTSDGFGAVFGIVPELVSADLPDGYEVSFDKTLN